MKFEKGRIMHWLLFICVILILGGCGKDSQDNGRGQVSGGTESDIAQRLSYKDIRYLPEFTDISESCNAMTRGIGFLNGTLYLMKRDISETDFGYNVNSSRLVAYRPDTGEEKVLLDEADMGTRIETAAPLPDGSVILLSGYDYTGYEICRMDVEGNMVYSRDIPITEELSNYRFAADGQGRSYLLFGEEVLLFDEEGGISGKVDVSGKWITRMACSSDGVLYLYEQNPGQLIPVDYETASLGTAPCTLPFDILCSMAATKDGNFLLCDTTTVYQYSCEDGNLTPLFDLQDSQIFGALSIDTMGETEDGRIFIFSRDAEKEWAETAFLSPTPLAECPVKEVITIGVIEPDTYLLEDVAGINRQNEDFIVSIMNYRVGGRDFQEAQAALKLDLSVGKGPDICVLDHLDEPEKLFQSGCFVDLSPYLEESGQYEREDFVEQALESYIWQEQLMAIPKYFKLRTIVGKSDIVGTDMGWDMEELIGVIQEHPDAMVFEDRRSSYMFDVCMHNMLKEFVDFESNEAHLDSPEYIAFLDFLANLPDYYKETMENGYYVHMYQWLKEERALLSCTDIHKITNLQDLKVIFGGGYTCIGYPDPDKEPNCIITGSNALAISASSPKKDMAWRFIEWSNSTQGEERSLTAREGFPTRYAVLEQEMKGAMEGTGIYEYIDTNVFFLPDGTSVAYHKVPPEDVELLYSLIESAGPERNTERIIIGIMKEEAAYLYDGSKTAEEVAKVTQNRVQLYLDE